MNNTFFKNVKEEIIFACYILNSYDLRSIKINFLSISTIIYISNIYDIKLITEIIEKIIKINRSNISNLFFSDIYSALVLHMRRFIY